MMMVPDWRVVLQTQMARSQLWQACCHEATCSIHFITWVWYMHMPQTFLVWSHALMQAWPTVWSTPRACCLGCLRLRPF